MYEKAGRLISFAIFLIGISFIIYGVIRGEVDTVFSKAIKICLECVGIG